MSEWTKQSSNRNQELTAAMWANQILISVFSKGEIPCHNVNGRLRFDPDNVRPALHRIASLSQWGADHAR